MFNGKISGGQLFKNVATTTGAVAGGAAGWIGGAAAGATLGSLVPLVGTAAGAFVGGIIGSLTGGSIGGTVTNKALNTVIEEDAKKMLKIFETELENVLKNEFLTTYEAELLIETLKSDIDYDALKEMYASGNYAKWANAFIRERYDDILSYREYVELPNDEEWAESLRRVLENIIDGKDISANLAHQRKCFLEQKRKVLDKYNILPRQMPKVMRPVKKMNKTLMRTENVLKKAKKNEEKYVRERNMIIQERSMIKNEIKNLMQR